MMECKELSKLSLEGLLLLKNSGLVGQHRTHISVKRLHILCDEDSVLLVSSQNASKRSVREGTRSSRSVEGLERATSVGGCGGSGGG